MGDEEPQVTNEEMTVLALRSVADTMKKVHSVFICFAIGIPILLVLFMALMLVCILWWMANSEERLANRVDQRSNEIMKSWSVTNNNQHTINVPSAEAARDKRVEAILRKNGSIE